LDLLQRMFCCGDRKARSVGGLFRGRAASF